MKHLRLLPLLWLLSFFSHGQIISVNDASHPESSYGPEQLIKDVLISSDCITASNFSSKLKGLSTNLADRVMAILKHPHASTIVIESFPPESVSAEFLLTEFSTLNKLKVEVTEKGEYEYALDDGHW